MDIVTKREQEKETVSLMVRLYCRKKHHSKTLCPDCAALDAYARSRSDRCPFMETKTFCSNCKVHCYKPDMREKIREVMRFSGPRMLFYHPIMAIRHVMESRKEKMLTAFCFARSSEKLDRWFRSTKLYEEILKDFVAGKGMTKKTKIRIMVTVTLLMSIGFVVMGLRGIVSGCVVLGLVWVFHIVYFVFGVRTYQEEPAA